VGKVILILALISIVLISGCVGKGVNISGNFTINDGNVQVQPNAISVDAGVIMGSISDFIKGALSIPIKEKASDNSSNKTG
jgi:hypothetical protein